ncbi:MAG: hypothetical protein U0V70_13065 [Terriglobia bacterium]
MRPSKYLLAVFSILYTMFAFSTLNFTKPVDAKKTGKSCTFCHVKYGSKDLTDAGKYYKDKGTLDGYK